MPVLEVLIRPGELLTALGRGNFFARLQEQIHELSYGAIIRVTPFSDRVTWDPFYLTYSTLVTPRHFVGVLGRMAMDLVIRNTRAESPPSNVPVDVAPGIILEHLRSLTRILLYYVRVDDPLEQRIHDPSPRQEHEPDYRPLARSLILSSNRSQAILDLQFHLRAPISTGLAIQALDSSVEAVAQLLLSSQRIRQLARHCDLRRLDMDEVLGEMEEEKEGSLPGTTLQKRTQAQRALGDARMYLLEGDLSKAILKASEALQMMESLQPKPEGPTMWEHLGVES